LVFILPFFFLFFFRLLFYSTDKGDLLRVGYVMDGTGYDKHVVFKSDFEERIYYKNISDITLNSKDSFDVLVIGDSFSDQGVIGYKNYLAKIDGITVLHFDALVHHNPVQTLIKVLNGNIFKRYKIKFVILESIERDFVARGNIVKNAAINQEQLMDSIMSKNAEIVGENQKDKFFSRENLTFAFNTFCYRLDDNAFHSQTYNVNTIDRLFSVDKRKLLFYDQDLMNLDRNNNIDSVKQLNNELNDLADSLTRQGIKLIVLPCPDKFDFYYDHIIDSTKYSKPLFFDIFRTLPKSYLYVDSKEILRREIDKAKDLYLYDDTHWSPYSAQKIASALATLVKYNK